MGAPGASPAAASSAVCDARSKICAAAITRRAQVIVGINAARAHDGVLRASSLLVLLRGICLVSSFAFAATLRPTELVGTWLATSAWAGVPAGLGIFGMLCSCRLTCMWPLLCAHVHAGTRYKACDSEGLPDQMRSPGDSIEHFPSSESSPAYACSKSTTCTRPLQF
jgi:hypothetical protein